VSGKRALMLLCNGRQIDGSLPDGHGVTGVGNQTQFNLLG
jgi:hypothetical protein